MWFVNAKLPVTFLVVQIFKYMYCSVFTIPFMHVFFSVHKYCLSMHSVETIINLSRLLLMYQC